MKENMIDRIIYVLKFCVNASVLCLFVYGFIYGLWYTSFEGLYPLEQAVNSNDLYTLKKRIVGTSYLPNYEFIMFYPVSLDNGKKISTIFRSETNHSYVIFDKLMIIGYPTTKELNTMPSYEMFKTIYDTQCVKNKRK